MTDGEFKRRLRELDRVCNHRRNGREIGDVAYKQMTAENMATIRDEMKRTTGARDNLLRIISALFYWAGGVGLMDPNKNPCHGVRSVHKKVGFHTWTEEEVEKYERRHPVGTTARLALGLGMFTVLRRKDLAILGPQHCWNGRITITPAKTAKKTRVEVNIPMLDCLAELVAVTPTGETAFLLNEQGRPFKTPACLGNAMQRWTEEAGIPHCSLHGLRKMGAVRAAMNGATVHQMMAIFGWAGLSQAEAYSRMAQRQLMAKAGIHTLARRPARDEQDPAAEAAEG